MTLEQCIQGILDRQSQVSSLDKEIRERKEKISELVEYKYGDLVEITWSNNGKGETKEQVYVKGAEWCYGAPHWKYLFNKVKKDGTMSGQSAGIWSHPNNITLIKKAEQ